MILLKQFMVWVTASNQIPRPMFQSLRWRLLLSYLAAMAAILGTFGAVVYLSFSRSLDQQLNRQLLTLAKAAVPHLDSQLLTLNEVAGSSRVATSTVGTIDTEGLQSLIQESPWRDLAQSNQSLEWFNGDGKLLAREGAVFSTLALAGGLHTRQQDKIRSFTIAVSTDNGLGQKTPLKGYVRASTSIREAEVALQRLSLGLSLGGMIALILSAVGCMRLSQRTLEPVEHSFQQLKQLTVDVSHELRSPLTAIKTSIDVILSHPERIHPSNGKKLLAIASATEQITHLAEDLLFLARLDATVLPPSAEQIPVSLDKVLQDLMERLEPQAQAKRIAFGSNLPPGISTVANAAELSRLFANLLENALQYTPAGGRVILSGAKDDRSVVIQVEDTGIGIASDNLPFIFQRFWRGDKARSQRVEGLGLGLTIAQTVAQRHGGEIIVSSKLGVGSCFQVHLPLS